jgi:hypothetical protein
MPTLNQNAKNVEGYIKQKYVLEWGMLKINVRRKNLKAK